MGWRKEQFLLWSSDGTNDITLGTSGNLHNIPLDVDDPPNDVVDTTSAANYYNPTYLDRINVQNYEKFGLYSVTRPVQGTVAVNWTATPPVTTVAVPVPVGSMHEGNALLNSPWNAAPAAQHLNALYAQHQICWQTPAEVSLAGIRADADGNLAGAPRNGRDQWASWGWRSGAVANVNPLDVISSMIWLGYPSVSGNTMFGAWEGLPSVMAYDEIMVSLMWDPQWAGAITTPLRILGKVWGIGLYQE